MHEDERSKLPNLMKAKAGYVDMDYGGGKMPSSGDGRRETEGGDTETGDGYMWESQSAQCAISSQFYVFSGLTRPAGSREVSPARAREGRDKGERPARQAPMSANFTLASQQAEGRDSRGGGGRERGSADLRRIKTSRYSYQGAGVGPAGAAAGPFSGAASALPSAAGLQQQPEGGGASASAGSQAAGAETVQEGPRIRPPTATSDTAGSPSISPQTVHTLLPGEGAGGKAGAGESTTTPTPPGRPLPDGPLIRELLSYQSPKGVAMPQDASPLNGAAPDSKVRASQGVVQGKAKAAFMAGSVPAPGAAGAGGGGGGAAEHSAGARWQVLPGRPKSPLHSTQAREGGGMNDVAARLAAVASGDSAGLRSPVRAGEAGEGRAVAGLSLSAGSATTSEEVLAGAGAHVQGTREAAAVVGKGEGKVAAGASVKGAAKAREPTSDAAASACLAVPPQRPAAAGAAPTAAGSAAAAAAATKVGAGAAAGGAGGAGGALSGVRVLLAEDNLVNQRVATHALKKQGAEVVVVGNGQLAVDAIRPADHSFDIVLMDIQVSRGWWLGVGGWWGARVRPRGY